MNIYIVSDLVAEKPIFCFLSENDKTALRQLKPWLLKQPERRDFGLSVVNQNLENIECSDVSLNDLVISCNTEEELAKKEYLDAISKGRKVEGVK